MHGWGPHVPRASAPTAKRQQSSHMCSERTLTGHLLCARLSSRPGGGEQSYKLWDHLEDIWEGLGQVTCPKALPSVACQPWAQNPPILSYRLCPGPFHPPTLRTLPCVVCCSSTTVSLLSKMLCASSDPTFVSTDPTLLVPRIAAQHPLSEPPFPLFPKLLPQGL